MNGETNVTATRTAKEAGVKQAVLVNASMPPALTPRGYFEGKRQAERAAAELASPTFGTTVLKPGGAHCVATLRHSVLTLHNSLALHPHASVHHHRHGPAIYGTRYVGTWPVPLWPVMAPASAVMRRLPGSFFAANAPVSVRTVAAAAVDAATDPSLRGRHTVWENIELFNHRPVAT